MRLTILFLVCCAGFLPDTMGQRVLMEETPVDFTQKDYGRNRAHFFMGVFRFGVAVDGENNRERRETFQLGMGLRFKRKIIDYVHLNLDLAYEYQHYFREEGELLASVVSTNPNSPLPGLPLSVPLNDIRTMNHAIELAPTLRFRFSRGNKIGAYVDAGVFGQYIVGSSRSYSSRDENNEVVTVNFSSYQPSDAFSYGWTARLGLAYFNIYWRQRLNELYPGEGFRQSTVGIEINLY